MPTSPVRYHASPSPSAEIRSQAIAKLKRAASLPRTPDGRRPPQPLRAAVPNGPSAPGSGEEQAGVHSRETTPPPKILNDYADDEEFLSLPPGGHAGAGNMPPSSYHIPAPQLTYSAAASPPFYPGQQTSPVGQPGPDWAAYQLAQSYLPSISPTSAPPPSAFPSNLHTPTGLGRNTPSPLPTLGELRNLSRSNSAAARAKAMDKLIGGRAGSATPTRGMNVQTPSTSDEDVILQLPGGPRPLHRAGTIAAPRMFGLTADQPVAVDDIDTPPAATLTPDTAFDVPRQRLQRSFTVSSSNMGEERRSAVGRRMVERLAERRAARQREDVDVKMLWQERRRTRGTLKGPIDGNGPESPESERSDGSPLDESRREDFFNKPTVIVPESGLSPVPASASNRELRAIADRALSRSTQRSDEAFEYEAHLRRSLSSRTARDQQPRDGRDDTLEASPEVLLPSPLIEDEAECSQPSTYPRPQGASMQDDAASHESAVSPRQWGRGRPHGSESTGSGDMEDAAADLDTSNDGLNSPERSQGSSEMTSQEDTVAPQVLMGYADSSMEDEGGRGDLATGERLEPGRNQSSCSRRIESWEDVSPDHDREFPTDAHYLKKSGSVTAKMGRAFTAMRKGSLSRSPSTATSPPTSPREYVGFGQAIHGPTRRGSEASSRSGPHVHLRDSPTTDKIARHKPSSSSLAPSSVEDSVTSANTLLIQHQLSNAPSPISFLPRPDPSDPRILHSKLSPFPGIAALEHRGREGRGGGSDTNHELKGTIPDLKREVSDGGAKRGWMKNINSSRSSGSGSRASGSESQNHSHYSHQSHPSDEFRSPISMTSSHENEHLMTTPKARSEATASHPRPKLDIPALTTNRRRPPPPMQVTDSNVATIQDDSPGTCDFPHKSTHMLERMDNILSRAVADPAGGDFLQNPPRKLLLAQQVLQVVNSQTVKDRYLFLFNDILVITKPLLAQSSAADMNMKFVVKSIVGLDKLIVGGLSEELESPRHPIVQQFVQRFKEDPIGAVGALVDSDSPRVNTATLADILFKTPELDKAQVGGLLASEEHLLRDYLGHFRFRKVRIDEALRTFLLTIRLPADVSSAEALLRGFANEYSRVNEHRISYDHIVAGDLVLAIMELNDMLYSTFGFAFPNHAVSQDTFIRSFHSRDQQRMVSMELLEAIYASIRANKLLQALSSQEAQLARHAAVVPDRLPSKLTFHEWSDPICIKLPQSDPSFKITLGGEGLEFDPPALDFSASSEATFRVCGLSLGSKSMFLSRSGPNAALYGDLGLTRSFTVERDFMRHTFQIAFMSQQSTKRKYCFALPDAAARQRWCLALSQQVRHSAEAMRLHGVVLSPRQREQRAADVMSLQILREALIPLENLANGPAGANHSKDDSAMSKSARIARMGSVSIAYASRLAGDDTAFSALHPAPGGGDSGRLNGTVEPRTGKELVLLCQQNSLLPGVIEMLQASAGPSPTGGAHSVPPRAAHLRHPSQPLTSAGFKQMSERRL